jgi:hypothetical protein
MMVIRRDLIKWGNGSRPQVFLFRYSNPMVFFFRFPGFFLLHQSQEVGQPFKNFLFFFNFRPIIPRLNYFFNIRIYLNVVNVFLVEKN